MFAVASSVLSFHFHVVGIWLPIISYGLGLLLLYVETPFADLKREVDPLNFEQYTDEGIRRWISLRAIEWGNWPAYLSQPVAPVLFILYPWYFIVLGILASGFVWSFFRYSCVSARLADAAVLPVMWLKWPAAIGSCIYLVIHQRPLTAVAALLWPILAAFVGVPAKRDIIESSLAREIGYVPPDGEL